MAVAFVPSPELPGAGSMSLFSAFAHAYFAWARGTPLQHAFSRSLPLSSSYRPSQVPISSIVWNDQEQLNPS